MNTNDTSNVGTKGNTKPSSNRGRRWCMTINNYDEKNYTRTLEYFAVKKCQYIVAKEVGESGTPHLQIYVEYKNPIAFNTLKKIFPRAHISKSRGTREHNLKYCTKEGNYETNFEWDYKPNGDLKLCLLKHLLHYSTKKGMEDFYSWSFKKLDELVKACKCDMELQTTIFEWEDKTIALSYRKPYLI